MADSRVMQREKSSAELRKINKPLVEKRRRERINSCLETLKTLILDATKKDTIRYSKLEKADILEMTVKHLRDVARSQHGGFEPQTSTITKYRAGFNECATEVTRYLAKDETLSPELRMRLLNHLASRLQNVNTIANAVPTQHAYPSHNIQQAVPTATPLTSLPGLNFGSGSAAYPAATAPPNPTQVPMLVPTRLPNGQIAYVLSDSQKANIKAQQQQAEMITSTPVNKKVKSEFFDMNLSNVAGTPPQSSIRGMDYRSFIHRSNRKRRVSDRSSLGFSKSSLTDSANQSSFVDSGIELDDSSRSFKAPKRLTPRASATISSPPLNSSEDFSAASVKTDSLSISPTGSTAYSLISSPSPKSALSENLPPKRLCVNESDNDSLKLFDEEDEQEEVDPGYDDPVPRGHDQDQDSDLDHNGNDALAENMNLSDANDSTGFRVQDHDSRETNETSEGISREGVNYNVYAHNLAIGGAYDDHGVWRPW